MYCGGLARVELAGVAARDLQPAAGCSAVPSAAERSAIGPPPTDRRRHLRPGGADRRNQAGATAESRANCSNLAITSALRRSAGSVPPPDPTSPVTADRHQLAPVSAHPHRHDGGHGRLRRRMRGDPTAALRLVRGRGRRPYLHVLDVTGRLDGAWITQQVGNLVIELGDCAARDRASAGRFRYRSRSDTAAIMARPWKIEDRRLPVPSGGRDDRPPGRYPSGSCRGLRRLHPAGVSVGSGI